MLSLGCGLLSKITGAPPRGHVTALHTSAPCESNRKGVRFGGRSGQRKQSGSEMKERKREQTTPEPLCAHCPFVTKQPTNKLPPSFGGRAALPLCWHRPQLHNAVTTLFHNPKEQNKKLPLTTGSHKWRRAFRWVASYETNWSHCEWYFGATNVWPLRRICGCCNPWSYCTPTPPPPAGPTVVILQIWHLKARSLTRNLVKSRDLNLVTSL